MLVPPAPSPPRVKRWYGAYTLATDGASLVLAVAGGVLDREGEGLVMAGLGGYLVGGPIVHLAHGNPGRSLLSLGTRAGLPVTVAFLGVAAENCGGRGDFCGLGGAIIGFGLGMVAAVAIDAAAIARDEVEPPVTFSPVARVNPDGAWLGVVGAY